MRPLALSGPAAKHPPSPSVFAAASFSFAFPVPDCHETIYRLCAPPARQSRISAAMANDRRRAAWSWMWPSTISSSALVRSMKAARPARTLSGPPTKEQDSACSSCARSTGATKLSKSAIGGGRRPGRPRRRLTKLCCSEVNRRSASRVGVGRDHVDADHGVGTRPVPPTARTGCDRAPAPASSPPARNARRRRRAGRACAASCALNRLEPSSQIGTVSPAPGTARIRWPGDGGREIGAAVPPRLRGSGRRSVVHGRGAARGPSACRCPARGRGRDRCGPETSDSSVPNCSAITSGAWFGSMIAARADADALGAAGDMRDDHRGRRAGDARHVVMLRQPDSAGSPSARRAARDRPCCGARPRRSRLRRSARDRESRTGPSKSLRPAGLYSTIVEHDL